jgi:hypothetical protein
VLARDADRQVIRIMDELYLKAPSLGSRPLVPLLERDHGILINRMRLQRLRRAMGRIVAESWSRVTPSKIMLGLLLCSHLAAAPSSVPPLSWRVILAWSRHLRRGWRKTSL